MKQSLRYIDLALLRIIPTAFLLFNVRNSFQAFSGIDTYTFRLLLPRVVFILCFVLLGISGILNFFNRNQILSVALRCFICVSALIYIGLYTAEQIETIKLCSSLNYQPEFFDSFLDVQEIIYIIGFSIVLICSLLKDKLFKVKWILTVICALSFLAARFCELLYILINYNDTIGFRLLFNSFLFSYCYCAVILTGLSPSKFKRSSYEVKNEED